MSNIVFANKEFLYFLLIIPLIILWYILKDRKSYASFQRSSLIGFRKNRLNLKNIIRHVLFGLRMLATALLMVALARPQTTDSWENITTEGIDIALALDISGSMLAEDFKPNRLEASKDLAIKFISGRTDDRIGLVVFSGESFTQCPLTTDHAVLINLFKDIKSGMIEDGTAIGLGLANAVSRLKDSKAKSRVIILLTDGENNRGEIAPETAAELAKTFGIRVYTIGVGSNGTAPYPVNTPFGTQYQSMQVKIDEATLTKIAHLTDGKYFRATSNQRLSEIYQEIDQLEKSKIEVKEYSRKDERYAWFAIPALIILLLDLLLRSSVYRQII